MPKVIYTTDDGLKEVRIVPNGLSTSSYHMGILIGPPELDHLELDKESLLKLNHALVEAGFLRWPDLSGQRHRIMEIVARLVPPEEQRQLRNKILAIYQQAYYEPVSEEKM
jgi:hypothetical protein